MSTLALSPLTALSPLDGRYEAKVAPLRALFSEWALMRFRVKVEVEWLKALAAEPTLAEVPAFSPATVEQLDALAANFSEADGQRIKAIEATTNHDVKAIEYFLKERLAQNAEVVKVAEFIHFACTSEDINNLCHALMLKHARDEVMPQAQQGQHDLARSVIGVGDEVARRVEFQRFEQGDQACVFSSQRNQFVPVCH